MAFVGGILLDFDYNAMSKILKVPDEKFRDKVFKTMEENLTTMKRELGTVPPREEVVAVLKEKFEKEVGRLTQTSLNSQILEKMNQLESLMTSGEFLYKKTPKIPKAVKIREGVEIFYGLHKARGGLIRTAEEISGNQIEDIAISGDFTFYPKEHLMGLEESLKKAPLEANQIIDRVEKYYQEKEIESPGVESQDFAETILPPALKLSALKGGASR
jgi:lipoate-protein ligase A